jgi:predicted RNA polymerase sigma factor
MPDNPKGWLITAAARRRIDAERSQAARRRCEQLFADQAEEADLTDSPAPPGDDSLETMLLCCHPALIRPAQVTLTLRIVAGLTSDEIARGLLLPEPTVAQRISRAKQRIRASELGFRLPGPEGLAERITAVLNVLYLLFNEGHTARSGAELYRSRLTAEAIRLTRALRHRMPHDGEVAGLLALMLLTAARRPARTRPDGSLVPLAEQDRSRWDASAIAEGTALITGSLATAPIGPYQLQAAIAAVHGEASSTEDTDWPQILGLYTLLRSLAPSPMVTLNRIVALAMVHGPAAALTELERACACGADPTLAAHYRVDAVRAHLLDLLGEHAAARDHYRSAARHTLNLPERDYLLSWAAAEK